MTGPAAALRPVHPCVGVLRRARATVGEGPVASADGHHVHWVDIFAGHIHTTDLATGETTTMTVDTLVGAVARRAGGGFVAATREGFAAVGTDGVLDTRCPILPSGTRMNDAAVDASGRFWAGSTAMDFAAGQGALHVLLPDWTTVTVLEGLTLPNGLGWSPDGATFYLVDSLRRTLTAYPADPTGTRLGEPRVIREFSGADGLPDGLTVDRYGDLWVAMWGGSRIVRIGPDGELRQEIALPVRQPSSCAFGGPRRDYLLVTSAAQDLDLTDDALDGSLLQVSGLGARGTPSHAFAG